MTDPETLAEIDAEIAQLMETVERIQQLGEEAEIPAIQRNAKRVEGVATTLSDNLPEELVEE